MDRSEAKGAEGLLSVGYFWKPVNFENKKE